MAKTLVTVTCCLRCHLAKKGLKAEKKEIGVARKTVSGREFWLQLLTGLIGKTPRKFLRNCIAPNPMNVA